MDKRLKEDDMGANYSQKPRCRNCFYWAGNKLAFYGYDMKGVKGDECFGGIPHQTGEPERPKKDGIYTGPCTTLRTGPEFFCVHHVCYNPLTPRLKPVKVQKVRKVPKARKGP